MPRSRTNYNARSEEKQDVVEEAIPSVLMKVREMKSPVRVRTGPGTSYSPLPGEYLGKGLHNIVEVSPGPGSTAGWGKLSDRDGWVALDFVDVVK